MKNAKSLVNLFLAVFILCGVNFLQAEPIFRMCGGYLVEPCDPIGLDDAKFRESLPELRNMGVTVLYLAHTKISDASIQLLSEFGNLEELFLNDCLNISNVSALEGLNKLRYLDLSNTEITDESVRALSRLPKLAHLNLSGCKYVRSVKALEGVKTLSSLDISRCADVKTLPDLKRANWQYLCFFNSSDCFSLPESLQIDWDISMWRNGTDISPGAFGRFLEAPEFCSVEVNLFYFNSSTKCVEPKNPRALDDYTFQEALAQGGELSNGLLNWRRIKRLDLSRTCISARSLSDLDKCCRFLVFLDLTECLGLPVAVRRKWLLSNPNSMKDLLDTIRVEAAANHGFMDTIDD